MMSQDGLAISSAIRALVQQEPNSNSNPNPNPNSDPSLKRKRNLPGTPDPDAEVIALSPKSLMATNRFLCEICNKGFQRDQNLQLHRRGHNLPWKLKQRPSKELIKKKVYICPEKTCVHHDPSRALGDLTGIKKHFSRKHGEKKWKCEKCSKKYAVQSDWKAHSKICGTREHRCDCGTLFSRKDSFITHRAFCDGLSNGNGARFTEISASNLNLKNDAFSGAINNYQGGGIPQFSRVFRQDLASQDANGQPKPRLPLWLDPNHANSHLNSVGFLGNSNANYLALSSPPTNLLGSSLQMPWFNGEATFSGANNNNQSSMPIFPRGLPKQEEEEEEDNKGSFPESLTCLYNTNSQSQSQSQSQSHQQIISPVHLSATALLQKATQLGSTRTKPDDFMGSGTNFGVMSSSDIDSVHKYNYQNNRSDIDKFFRSQENSNECMDNYYISSSTAAAANGANIGDGQLWGDLNSTTLMATSEKNNLDHLILQSNENKQGRGVIVGRLQVGGNEVVEGGLTRDFLGVGGDEGGRSFSLQQELANFASMDSACLDLSHYSSSH